LADEIVADNFRRMPNLEGVLKIIIRISYEELTTVLEFNVSHPDVFSNTYKV